MKMEITMIRKNKPYLERKMYVFPYKLKHNLKLYM